MTLQIASEIEETEASRMELLTPQEAADYLRVPVSWVYERTRTRTIPVRKIGGGRLCRIPRDELIAWTKRG